MSEPAEAAAVGSPSRALRRGRPGGMGMMPDALPVLVASPGRATRQRQQQEQEEALAAAMAMAGGASGGVHARRPSTSSSASSSSSSSSSSTVSSDGGAGGETAAAAGGLHGSPTRRRRQQQQQQQAGGGLGALPTLHQVWAQPPSSPSKATRASSAAAAAGGVSIVAPASPLAHGGLKHDPDHHQAQAPPPVSPRPTERPGQGQGEGELQSSPLRRSQTQHVREAAEAAAASDSAEVPPGAGALLPGLVAPRIGEQYQIPAEALPRDMRDDVGASCCDPWNIAACAQKGLVWHPGDVGEEVAELFAGEVQVSMADGRCGDEGAELGWLVLRATGSVERAVAAAEDETLRGQWSREEEAAFVQGIKDHDKNFRRIKVMGW